jgi:hypothetical protein
LLFPKLYVENMVAHLMAEGFAIQRFDLQKPSGGFIFAELTPMGRILKECGSIDAYYKIQEEIKEKSRQQQAKMELDELRNDLQFQMNVRQTNINLWLMLITAGLLILEALRLWIEHNPFSCP